MVFAACLAGVALPPAPAQPLIATPTYPTIISKLGREMMMLVMTMMQIVRLRCTRICFINSQNGLTRLHTMGSL